MADPSRSGYIRYLAAKKSLDDRSLNRRVWERLVQAVRGRSGDAPLKVLEVGCGIGTMGERLLDWGLLTRATYTGIDVEAEFIREARRRFQVYAAREKAGMAAPPDEPLVLRTANLDVRVSFEVADLFDFLDKEQGRSSWDLLVAHAVLDLIDLDTALPRLLSLLSWGGLFYFTLNFDGATILEPIIDPELDRRLETLYHRTMDMRQRRGRPAGSSVTGRRLLGGLRKAGARLLAAGSSDWVVFPGPEGYPEEEAYFLHYLIDTIGGALQDQPELEGGRFENWLELRHRQIDAAELIYIAHQLDVVGCI